VPTDTTKLAVRERPILFSGPLVRAIIEGRKTQTRRYVKPQPSGAFRSFGELPTCDCHPFGFHDGDRRYPSPYGGPGDRLYVKESWCVKGERLGVATITPEDCHYRADDPDIRKVDGDGFQVYTKAGKEASPWMSGRFMPRSASRLILEITEVRVERLKAITEQDARAEGIGGYGGTHWRGANDMIPRASARLAFVDTWDRLYGDGAFDANPWTWVVGFRPVEVTRG
jgi:hypothetical protein